MCHTVATNEVSCHMVPSEINQGILHDFIIVNYYIFSPSTLLNILRELGGKTDLHALGSCTCILTYSCQFVNPLV